MSSENYIIVDSLLNVINIPKEYDFCKKVLKMFAASEEDVIMQLTQSLFVKCSPDTTYKGSHHFKMKIKEEFNLDLEFLRKRYNDSEDAIIIKRNGSPYYANKFLDTKNKIIIKVPIGEVSLVMYEGIDYILLEEVFQEFEVLRAYPYVRPNVDLKDLEVLIKGNEGKIICSFNISNLKETNMLEGYRVGTIKTNQLRRTIEERYPDSEIYYDGSNFYIVKETNLVSARDSCEKVREQLDFRINFACAIIPEGQTVTGILESLKSTERIQRDSIVALEKSMSFDVIKQMLFEVTSETEAHCERLSTLAVLLGEKMGLHKDDLAALSIGAYLHDIGKIGIKDSILNKAGKLTPIEWTEMKEHTTKGHRILEKFRNFEAVAQIVRNHHERFDGTGYPDKLIGEEIPLLVRIVTVVDSFDAILSPRSYKDKLSLDYAISELKRCSGTQFCPTVVSNFLEILNEQTLDKISQY